MNKKLIYSLLSLSMLLVGCETHTSSTPTDSTTNDSSSVESTPVESSSNSLTSSSSSSSSVNDGSFVKVDDASKLFLTYSSSDEYDYILNYRCDIISHRAYQGYWETEYMYDGNDLLLSYVDRGVNYTDYFIYSEEAQQWLYYLDSGTGLYQYLDESAGEMYYLYVSLIDYFELAGIEWEEDMVFDLTNKVCKPVNDLAKDRVGKMIFGDNANEYWHSVEISWDNGFITKVNAISIIQEATYYYTIDISEHGFISGSVKVPENVEKWRDPNQPYLKGREEYTGGALTDAQAAALTMFTNEKDMNYTADVRWTLVNNGIVYDDTYVDFHIEAENGNYFYSYEDSSYAGVLTHKFYLLTSGNSYPVCFHDEDFDGVYSVSSYGMDDYNSYVGQIYLDRVLLYGLDPKDFIYDESKGYITAKNEALEAKYCGGLFFYENMYGGLRIYLEENDDGSLSIDKIVTSMFAMQSDGSYISLLKTYDFSNISSTTITYPDGVGL